MHSSAFVVLAGAGAAIASLTGSYETSMAPGFSALFERQTRVCKPVPPPLTCERSCGPGYITCISLPTCYNPGKGDVCCSDGSYCRAGTYCTDGGCCPNGTSLAECGATKTLATVAPGSPETNSPTALPTASPQPVTTSAVASAPGTTASTETAATTTETPAAPPLGTGGSNISATATGPTAPPIATAAAPQAASVGGALQLLLGGLGVWLLV